jgi:hypothetical protein
MSREISERTNNHELKESRDTLMLLGGVSLVVFGAGLILSAPTVREYLGGVKIGNLLGAVIPKDLQRYMRLRAM